MLPTNKKLGILIAIFSAICFGLWPPASQLAYRDGASVSLVILATTFFRALTLTISALIRKQRILLKPGEWRVFISGGFFQSVSIIGLLGSLKYLPGPVTITILYTHTLMLLLYLAWRKEIRLNLATVISTVMALIGVALVVNVVEKSQDLSLLGIGLAFLGALATMSRLYVFGSQVKLMDPSVVGARIFTIAFCLLLLLLPAEPLTFPRSSVGYFGIMLSCLSLVLGTFGMFYGIKILGAFEYSLISKLEPIVTGVFAILILGEFLNAGQYLGMGLVIVSLVGYQVYDARQKSSLVG